MSSTIYLHSHEIFNVTISFGKYQTGLEREVGKEDNNGYDLGRNVLVQVSDWEIIWKVRGKESRTEYSGHWTEHCLDTISV